MANPFYVPAGPSLGERVAQPLTELMRIRQAGQLGEEHNRLAGEDIALRSRGLDFQAQSLAETQKMNREKRSYSKENFGPEEKKAFMETIKQIDPENAFKWLDKATNAMVQNPKADKGYLYGHLLNNWDTFYQKQAIKSVNEVLANPETDPATKEYYTELLKALESPNSAKVLDKLMPNVAMEWQAAQAEMLSKLPQGNAPKVVGRSLIDPNTGQVIYRDPDAVEKTKTPNDLVEFEMFTYGKEMPQLRGTPEYKDAMMGYMKSKRDATVAPSKSDPAVLRKEFIGQSKDFVTIRDSYNRIKASVDKPSPAGDLALIFNYMKMLDPGSVVRESEFATAAASGSYGERIKAAVGKVMKGEKLSDAMRMDFVDRSNKLYKSQLDSHEKLKGEYDRISTGLGVEPSSVIIDYLTEQNDIQNEKYDIGDIYVGQDGTSRIYKGKDSTGKHIWIQVQ